MAWLEYHHFIDKLEESKVKERRKSLSTQEQNLFLPMQRTILCNYNSAAPIKQFSLANHGIFWVECRSQKQTSYLETICVSATT